MEKLDLALIAEGITAPFQLVRTASLGRIDVSLVICGGRKSWHRSPGRDELAVVLDGVVMIEGSTDRHVVGEGNIARLPARSGLAFSSGMRSKLLFFQQQEPDADRNGFEQAEEVLSAPEPIVLEHFAQDVRDGDPFEWRETGRIASYATRATRVAGISAPYEVPRDGLGLLVYRGIVDVSPLSDGSGDHGDEAGEPRRVVGSEWLTLNPEERVTFSSRRGATALILAREDVPLPRPAPADRDEGIAPSATDGGA